MSRTRRRIIAGQTAPAKTSPESAARKSFDHLIKRDNAATGLRDHKRERAMTRRRLKEDPEREDVRAGRSRKYQDIRGVFEL